MFKLIEKTVEIIRSGGVILYPTDTIWGIGCDARNEDAVRRIYTIKNRDDAKSMLVLVSSFDMIYDYVYDVPEIAQDLVEFSEKPMTIIYPNAINLAKNLVANDNSIGIRVVKDKFCSELIKKLNCPLVSTSANISGESPPLNFCEISTNIKKSCDYIVPHKQNETSKSNPSSIIKLEVNGEFKVLRK